ncbi:HET-domain-containing protein, partial [Lophiostoma macrostomum CBS 122681]
PTRLLDLGSQGCTQSSDIRLVSYENGFRYIALSHRWGGSQHFTTTRFNVHNHKRGIRFADLPKTFQDSIVVARSLDIRYLWIDALCIIQDDENEWHGEALLMGNIYRNAECTIAVHDAPDDSAGFLEASLQSPKSVSIECAQDNTSLTVSLRSNFRAAVDRSELTRRGWVLQERYLSSRTLHFTETSIFLEDGSSSFPSLLAADPFDSRLSPFNIGTRMHNQKYDFAWFKLLERYSATKLTYESDKLPAISGLVKLLQQDIQGRFVMGVWDTMFHKGLLWAAHLYPLMRPRHRRAPSWSWVS